MDLSGIIDFLDRYSITIGNTILQPLMLIWVVLFMGILCLVRSVSIIKMSNVKLDSASKWYIFSVDSICWLFGSVVSILLVCISGNPDNLMINGILFPIVGFLGSLWFEGIVISKMNKTVLDRYEKKCTSKSDKDKKSGLFDKLVGDRSTSPVIINIDNNVGKENVSCDDVDNSYKYTRKLKTLQDMIKEPTKEDYITEEDIKGGNHKQLFMVAINDLRDVQYSQAVELKNHLNMLEEQSVELKAQSAILVSVRDTMMTDKKFKLKKMMYDCLNKGYVTPEENDVITADYRCYVSLEGNGEVKELYEQHYIKLPVHEDRRVAQVMVPVNKLSRSYDDGDRLYIPQKI